MFLTCGIGKRRSSLFKSLRISGARRVGRRLPLYAVLTVVVAMCTVALIEGEGGNVTRSRACKDSIIGIGRFAHKFTQAEDLSMVASPFEFARVLTQHSQITKARFNGWSTVNRDSTYEVFN